VVKLTGYFENLIRRYIPAWYFPNIHFTDVLEVIILSFIIYQLLKWIKNTKAWMLLKGMVVILVFILVAAILRMNTILYLAKNSLTVLATAAIVVFQPELRRALEKLGEKNYMPIINSGKQRRASDYIVDEIVEASFDMGQVKTGALIVIENVATLTEYENTGIPVDAIVSRQLLINIFEHNTPLHDGAVMIRDNRIVSATCYLPLSENMKISKELGTRHRAAVGMSEVSDAMVIVVSEETGAVSLATGGKILRNLSKEEIKEELISVMETTPVSNSIFNWLKGGRRHEE
jgi:diadenylate cyclase